MWKKNPLFRTGIILLVFGAVRLLMKGIGNGEVDLAGICALAAGALVFTMQKWLRFTALLLLAPTLFFAGYEWITAGGTAGIIPTIICLLAFIWLGRKIWRHHVPEDVDRPLVALVWLMREARGIELPVLRNMVENALGVKLKGENENAEDWIVGQEPLYMMHVAGGMFSVNVFPQPYIDQPNEVAADEKNRRIAKILEEHKAWVSVDWFGFDDGSEDRDRAYRLIAKVMAELANENCLALFCPETNALVEYSEEVTDRLRHDNAMEVFQEQTKPPVIQISEDDPRMAAAVAEARRRWPEFVSAFQKRKPGEEFAIKAPVSSGGITEFIWIEVKGIAGDVIFGELANDPMDLEGLKLGSPVEIELKDLNDWTYPRGGDYQGMFTTRILMEAAQQA